MNKMRKIAALTGVVALTGLAGFAGTANAATAPKSSGYLVAKNGETHGVAASPGPDPDFAEAGLNLTVGLKRLQIEKGSVHTKADPLTGASSAEVSLGKISIGIGSVDEVVLDEAVAKCTAGPGGTTASAPTGPLKAGIPGVFAVNKSVVEKLPDGGVAVDALRVSFLGQHLTVGHVECHSGVKPVETPVISAPVGAGAAVVVAGAAGVFVLRRRRDVAGL